MNTYLVTLIFNDTYEIEADSEEEALEEAFDHAIRVGEWESLVERVEIPDEVEY